MLIKTGQSKIPSFLELSYSTSTLPTAKLFIPKILHKRISLMDFYTRYMDNKNEFTPYYH